MLSFNPPVGFVFRELPRKLFVYMLPESALNLLDKLLCVPLRILGATLRNSHFSNNKILLQI